MLKVKLIKSRIGALPKQRPGISGRVNNLNETFGWFGRFAADGSVGLYEKQPVKSRCDSRRRPTLQ